MDVFPSRSVHLAWEMIAFRESSRNIAKYFAPDRKGSLVCVSKWSASPDAGYFFLSTVNTRYRHTLGTPKKLACNKVVSETRYRVTGTIARGPGADVPVTRESQNFALRGRELRLPCR